MLGRTARKVCREIKKKRRIDKQDKNIDETRKEGKGRH